MFERHFAGLLEQDIHDDSLRRCEHDVVHELLLLIVAAVTTDELQPRARSVPP